MRPRDNRPARRQRIAAVVPAGDLASIISPMEGLLVASDVPLDKLSTWRAGGPAKLLVEALSLEALRAVVVRAREMSVPVLVLGNGSNILVSDAGFDGIVLRLKGELAKISLDGATLSAGGGAGLQAAASMTIKASLGGLEFAVGIPGTVGGAVMTNAGTRQGSVASVLQDVSTLSPEGTDVVFKEFEDRYREPLVPRGSIVTAATFRLESAEEQVLRTRVEEARSMRASSQPQGSATAGSVFKNPPGDSAGRLIDACGLKGKVLGGASVSTVHANFIVNEKAASAADIKGLMDLVAATVKSKMGVALEPEVTLIGFEEGG